MKPLTIGDLERLLASTPGLERQASTEPCHMNPSFSESETWDIFWRAVSSRWDLDTPVIGGPRGNRDLVLAVNVLRFIWPSIRPGGARRIASGETEHAGVVAALAEMTSPAIATDRTVVE